MTPSTARPDSLRRHAALGHKSAVALEAKWRHSAKRERQTLFAMSPNWRVSGDGRSPALSLQPQSVGDEAVAPAIRERRAPAFAASPTS